MTEDFVGYNGRAKDVRILKNLHWLWSFKVVVFSACLGIMLALAESEGMIEWWFPMLLMVVLIIFFIWLGSQTPEDLGWHKK